MSVEQTLTDEYFTQLATYLAKPDETLLLRAHELGRRAAIKSIGVLDIASVHHHALQAITTGTQTIAGEKYLDMAAEFLAEFLSPFEMMLRGYRETNARLTATNQALLEAKVATESANQELEAFSYSVAHDLRAPLRALDGFSMMLMEDCAEKLDDEERRNLEFIRESSQHMGRIIDDLLALSHVARSELKREAVNLTEIARKIAARLQNSQPERRVDFVIADGLAGNGDARLLTIALENLIGNAWKYSGKREDARIEIGTVSHAGREAFFVRDNGAGFDMAYADKLFGVFQRLHKAEEFEGTGIGLATVKRIFNRHGGQIWAESEIGRGATFFFTLAGGPSAAANGKAPH
jgi:light-regulated signal transduction histidine kinase (bacteriophytochrome)